MRKLDSILNEKVNKIDEFRQIKQNSIENIEINYKKELKKIENLKNKEIENVRKEIVVETKKIEEEYSPKLTDALTEDLNQDYQIMQERCKYNGFSEGIINEAIKMKESLKKLEKESQEILKSGLRIELQELIKIDGLENLKTNKTITSYVIPNKEKCYILTPIKEKDCTELIQDLENKLLGVINLGKINVDFNEVLRFKGNELNYPRTFLMFEIESIEDTGYLAKQLVKKLNDKNIQPKEFIKNNLEHKAVVLDYSIFKSFLDGESEKKLTGESETKTASIRISKKYKDPEVVLTEYKNVNNTYRENHEGEDMNLSELLLQKINGKTHSDLYYSLIGHLRQKTIKPEEIQTRSNLKKYKRSL